MGKKQIAFITNFYKAISEQWMWRLIEYLKDSIGYIGVMENVEIDLHNNIPVVNIPELPLLKKAGLSSKAYLLAKSFFLLRKIETLEKKYNIDAYFIHFLKEKLKVVKFQGKY